MTSKNILITNLEWVTIHGIRTFTHALLLCEGVHPLDSSKPRSQLRGFGTDPSWPVFDFTVPSIEYTLEDIQGGPALQAHPWDGTRLIYRGAKMQFAGGPLIELAISNSYHPIQIDQSREDIRDVWAVLPVLVRKYWRTDGFPRILWGFR